METKPVAVGIELANNALAYLRSSGEWCRTSHIARMAFAPTEWSTNDFRHSVMQRLLMAGWVQRKGLEGKGGRFSWKFHPDAVEWDKSNPYKRRLGFIPSAQELETNGKDETKEMNGDEEENLTDAGAGLDSFMFKKNEIVLYKNRRYRVIGNGSWSSGGNWVKLQFMDDRTHSGFKANPGMVTSTGEFDTDLDEHDQNNDEIKDNGIHGGENKDNGKRNEQLEAAMRETTKVLTNILSKLEVIDVRLMEHDASLAEMKTNLKMVEEVAFSSCKKIEIKLPTTPKKELDEYPHVCLDETLKLVNGVLVDKKRKRFNVMLIGPCGSGKSYLAKQVAKILEFSRFAFVSFTNGMSEGQLLGRRLPTGSNGQFTFVGTEFLKCVEEGGLFLGDEVDAADNNMLLILNHLLSSDTIAVPNRTEKPYAKKHKDFAIILAANTFGTGADRQYVGRNQLDEAFLDRFRAGQVIVNYDPSLEAHLCPDSELRLRLQKYRENCENGKVRRVISSRFMENAYLLKTMGFDDEKIDSKLFAGWRTDEISKAKGSY